jgi:hypothetical protein
MAHRIERVTLESSTSLGAWYPHGHAGTLSRVPLHGHDGDGVSDTARRKRSNDGVLPLPRSDLLRRVLGALRDHPHDDTADRVAALLSLPRDDVQVALTALAEDGLVRQTRSHWVLSRDGGASARADDPFDDLD